VGDVITIKDSIKDVKDLELVRSRDSVELQAAP